MKFRKNPVDNHGDLLYNKKMNGFSNHTGAMTPLGKDVFHER